MATGTITQLENTFEYTPFAPDVLRDPYPYYRILTIFELLWSELRKRFPGLATLELIRCETLF